MFKKVEYRMMSFNLCFCWGWFVVILVKLCLFRVIEIYVMYVLILVCLFLVLWVFVGIIYDFKCSFNFLLCFRLLWWVVLLGFLFFIFLFYEKRIFNNKNHITFTWKNH